MSYGAGFVGKGCVAASFSPGICDAGTVRSTIGHSGSPVSRLNA